MIQKSSASSLVVSQGEARGNGYNDIQEQLGMLRTMPDFIRINNSQEDVEASAEEIEEEENIIAAKV